MTSPPRKLSTYLFALLLAACSDSDDKADAGGGGAGNDSGPSGEDSGAGGMAGGGNDSGGPAPMDGGGNRDGGGAAGGGDSGSADGGGAAGGNDASTGNDSGGSEAGTTPGPCSATAAPDVGKLGLEPVVTGLTNFVFAAQPPGSGDWYLVQQSGELLVRAAGATTNTMLLDLGAEINLSSGFGDDERGLLGLAFAPDFATSGIFYVMLTPTGNNQDQVRQYQKMGMTATMMKTLITLPASAVNHNGGHLVMREGLLYVGTGDGGGSCNGGTMTGFPQLVSSSPNSLFGKILRLDPSNSTGNYAASGNPFTENPLVWHLGLRNPFRFSFDSASGDLFVGDVGQDAYEEIDYAKGSAKGLNFGWARFEGREMTCGSRDLRPGDMHTEPVFIADRREVGCQGMFCDWISVIGGVVYRGEALPQLKGVYLFGDYRGVRMAAVRMCEAGPSPVTPIRKNLDPNNVNAPSFGGDDFEGLTAIVEDNAKEIYFVVNRNSLQKVVARP
jgi:glucose/arabinose dehydrogenase